MIEVKCLIIGGGVTGLSFASFFKDDFLLLEKESDFGGYCKTTIRGDYVWDYSGHFFHFRDKSIQEFATKNIECRIHEVEKISKIYYNDNLIDFPFQSNIHQLDKSEFIQCLVDFYNKDEIEVNNFVDLSKSKFGKSISEKFIIPYNTKLYACDLNKLDHNCMGRFIPSVKLDDIINSISGEKLKTYNDTFIYPEYGCYEFIKSISKDLDKNKLKNNVEVYKLDLDKKIASTSIGDIKFDKLVSSLPFNKLLKISQLDSKNLSCNKVVVFNIGFDKGTEIDAHWIYFPGEESFYRVGFYNNILTSEKMSLYVEIGLESKSEIDEKLLYQRVLSDLKKCGIVNEQVVVDYQMLVLDPAYVHITKDSMDQYDKWCQNYNKKGIYSIGRYGSWTYCSIEDNIIQSKKLANEI